MVEWTDHVQKLESTLNKMKEKVLKCNIKKYFFGQTEMEFKKKTYIKNTSNKNMKSPTSQK